MQIQCRHGISPAVQLATTSFEYMTSNYTVTIVLESLDMPFRGTARRTTQVCRMWITLDFYGSLYSQKKVTQPKPTRKSVACKEAIVQLNVIARNFGARSERSNFDASVDFTSTTDIGENNPGAVGSFLCDLSSGELSPNYSLSKWNGIDGSVRL